MKDKFVVHTQNKHKTEVAGEISWIVGNSRFGNYYYGEYNNTDRLSIVGIPNIEDKTISVGISFCTGGDNFSRALGTYHAEMRATSYWGENKYYKPYAIIPITEVEFSQEACLNVLYTIHDELIKLSVKEVKRLVNQQIVK